MKSSEPIWYDALRGNPLNRQGFTDELRAGIKQQAFHKSSRSHLNWRIAIGMFASVAVLVIFGLFAAHKINDNISENEAQSMQAAANEDQSKHRGSAAIPLEEWLLMPSSGNKVNAFDIQSYSQLNEQGQMVELLAYGSWEQVLELKYPDADTAIIEKKSIDDSKMLLFYRKLYESNGYRSISLSVDGFDDMQNQWVWSQSLSYSIGEPRESKQPLQGQWYDIDPNSFYFGVVNDPQIASIRIVDENGAMKTAEFVTDEYGYVYCFAELIRQNDYTVEGLNADGKVIYSEIKSFSSGLYTDID
ncbi:hypothetical protein [Paenibacillus sp. NEAU-GSW1]|uniref:hypothetical protein n=1 Tax=Paenibacillus sp. NEAU-GSW1 TaxID=2682486 RepID=UPI0012E19A46|nr:hypothetical protein [Paenibacillus sp. NEAU-GSW1]MUT66882.1 hypothetical protein [Paenibacillus sp. NEAU-GSW1]